MFPVGGRFKHRCTLEALLWRRLVFIATPFALALKPVATRKRSSGRFPSILDFDFVDGLLKIEIAVLCKRFKQTRR
jgi:hypothetical protein